MDPNFNMGGMIYCGSVKRECDTETNFPELPNIVFFVFIPLTNIVKKVQFFVNGKKPADDDDEGLLYKEQEKKCKRQNSKWKSWGRKLEGDIFGAN